MIQIFSPIYLQLTNILWERLIDRLQRLIVNFL